MPKGEYDRAASRWTPRSKRDYPAEIVELACSLYESGMTVREIADAFPKGYKVQRILERYLPKRRTAAKRDQRGEANCMWKGDAAKYAALHLRVEAARGKPQECSDCGRNDSATRYEWANVSGDYRDINDFMRLCISCHRTYDAARRRYLGTCTREVMSYV